MQIALIDTLWGMLFSQDNDDDEIESLAGAYLGLEGKKRGGSKPPKDNTPLVVGILLMIIIIVMLYVVIRYS